MLLKLEKDWHEGSEMKEYGTVIWYTKKGDYGFLKTGNIARVFLHCSECLDFFEIGDRVEFELCQDEQKRWYAKSARALIKYGSGDLMKAAVL